MAELRAAADHEFVLKSPQNSVGCSTDHRRAFSTETWTMIAFDSSRPDLAPYGFSCARWAPAVMRRPDRHNEIELNFLGEGSLTYLFGGQVRRVEARSVAAFWAAMPHQIIGHDGLQEYFVVTIPLGWFLRRKLPERLVQSLLHGRMLDAPCVERLSLDQRMLCDWERDLSGGDVAALEATYLEVEARLRRLAFACSAEDTATAVAPRHLLTVQDGGFAKAEQMAHLVAQKYTEPLTVDMLARELHLHRKLAMNLFHQVFGTSFISYVTQHRISHAQRLLVTSTMSVVDVAGAAGFGSLSHFNRAFRRLCGCAPREYRESHGLDPSR